MLNLLDKTLKVTKAMCIPNVTKYWYPLLIISFFFFFCASEFSITFRKVFFLVGCFGFLVLGVGGGGGRCCLGLGYFLIAFFVCFALLFCFKSEQHCYGICISRDPP